MAHAYSVQAVDRLLRNLTRTNALFGGKVVILGGDFHQTLPVVCQATRSGIVGACLKSSTLWPHFQVLQLVQNMRAGMEEQAFAAWLLELGNGQLPQSEDGLIELPMGCLEQGDLINAVFERTLWGEESLSGCAILSLKNAKSLVVNEAILALLSGITRLFCLECG
uniref:ATP-dependent DNA helicase n=1 Tax=Plectus sambesii TaxID=2011161 RepID=A0A914VVY7_9BILA